MFLFGNINFIGTALLGFGSAKTLHCHSKTNRANVSGAPGLMAPEDCTQRGFDWDSTAPLLFFYSKTGSFIGQYSTFAIGECQNAVVSQ